MTRDDAQMKANASARDALRALYDIHRPFLLGIGGVGSDMYAEAHGHKEVAINAVTSGREAALKKWLEEGCTEETARVAAREAITDVLDEARENNLIFIRDASRSATVVRAYLMA